jgi:hypothetical protein
MYKGVPDKARELARRLRPPLSEQDLDAAARQYHQQNGEGWEAAMVKDLQARVIEQDGRLEPIQRGGKPADGYLGTEG